MSKKLGESKKEEQAGKKEVSRKEGREQKGGDELEKEWVS
jgi:hypothetical protein